MKLTVNHSHALVNLVSTKQVKIDAIEWAYQLTLTEINATRNTLPGVAFHVHRGRMFFTNQSLAKLKDYLAACPETEAISIHLAPLPALITYPAVLWKVFLPEPNSKAAAKRFVNQVKWLQDQLDLPIILENMPVLHPKLYRFESEPATIRAILGATGCELLLDLAHARISAEARGLAVEDYLSRLPLELTRQIHLAGVRRDSKTGRLYDAHQSLSEEDYELLDWALTRTQPYLVTLEYFREDAEALKTQLERIRQLI
jgi:uncharacterized protein (UPF0276 family)